MSNGLNIGGGMVFCAIRGALLVLNFWALQSTASAARTYGHIDPKTGFRMGYYRAAVPDKAPGATRIGLDELKRLIAAGGAVLIDVMAHVGAGPDPLSGEWRLSKPRKNIPGSIWLPDVGAGYLTPRLTDYFRDNLKHATGGNLSIQIVIYCTADCWMSWNAVKRAAALGYSRLYWFSEGSDDWQRAGLPLVRAEPVPLKIPDQDGHRN